MLYLFATLAVFSIFSCGLFQKTPKEDINTFGYNGIYLVYENGIEYPFFSDSTIIYLIDTIPLIDLSDIEIARKQKNRYSREMELYIKLKKYARSEFASITKNHVLDTFAIILNNKLISAPKVLSEIPRGEISVNGIDEKIIDDFVNTFKIYKLNNE